jgi:hypothetical protein
MKRHADRVPIRLWVWSETKQKLVELARVWDCSQTQALERAVGAAFDRECGTDYKKLKP